MPQRGHRPCAHPGCKTLVITGRCAQHQRAPDQAFDATRGTSTQRGYNARWRTARITFLRLYPLCQCPDCQAGHLRAIPATVVDHIIPHRGDQQIFWDESNWQAMSKPCHDRKTATEMHARRSEALHIAAANT